MEGFYFFWATWISWVLVTFFMRHSLARTLFGFAILLTISLSGFSFDFAGHRIFATVFLLAVIGYLFIFASKRVGRGTFGSICLGIGYTGMLLWELTNPIALPIPRTLIFSLILFALVFYLTRDFYLQLGIICLGFAMGEVMYLLLLDIYGLHQEAGGFKALDVLGTVLLLLIVAKLAGELRKYLRNRSKWTAKRT
ncbi:hypothetical protein SAMN05421663_11179 [Terribacillus halophilus]|uniref:Uncharacterized protein n=1 Tax=Terribacillus halophilus TaxID=361279 RepID=A0A1G6V0S6_9BACI|nr:hypothetical protein [Terribacillus halophilus]SDD47151.1 hypothetical protein SAMN05421663_11179 [Terribacillus halophilus]